MELLIKNIEDTRKFAREFVEALSISSQSKISAATVVALYGNLGSGKTTFVQCVAEALGVTEQVTSPTFVIMKTYKLPMPSSLSVLRRVGDFRISVFIPAAKFPTSGQFLRQKQVHIRLILSSHILYVILGLNLRRQYK